MEKDLAQQKHNSSLDKADHIHKTPHRASNLLYIFKSNNPTTAPTQPLPPIKNSTTKNPKNIFIKRIAISATAIILLFVSIAFAIFTLSSSSDKAIAAAIDKFKNAKSIIYTIEQNSNNLSGAIDELKTALPEIDNINLKLKSYEQPLPNYSELEAKISFKNQDNPATISVNYILKEDYSFLIKINGLSNALAAINESAKNNALYSKYATFITDPNIINNISNIENKWWKYSLSKSPYIPKELFNIPLDYTNISKFLNINPKNIQENDNSFIIKNPIKQDHLPTKYNQSISEFSSKLFLDKSTKSFNKLSISGKFTREDNSHITFNNLTVKIDIQNQRQDIKMPEENEINKLDLSEFFKTISILNELN